MSQDKVLRPYSIGTLCSVLGYSRQAYYKSKRANDSILHELRMEAINKLLAARKIRPTAGCRYVYKLMHSEWPLGRDRTERLLLDMGYAVKRPKNKTRTTRPGGKVYPNLILDLKINNINQVWQSDMTYFYTQDGIVSYLIFVTDVYSQRIVGHGAYLKYPAEVFVDVLNRALRTRGSTNLKGLIHHSDRGSQYGSKIYSTALASRGILQSMCKYSWANPYAEKTNDLIKNGYLSFWKPKDHNQLKRLLSRAVHNENNLKIKDQLGGMTPSDYEAYILCRTEERRTLQLKPGKE